MPDEARGIGGWWEYGVGVGVGDGVGETRRAGCAEKSRLNWSTRVLLGAEVGGEAKRGERQVAEALGLQRADEAFHAGLAEEVDGLLRVADEKDGLRVAVPALR